MTNRDLRQVWIEYRGYFYILPALVIVLSVFIAPLIFILQLSLTDPTPGLGNYIDVFKSPVAINTIFRTFWMAGIVTVVCLLLGYPYAYLMTRVDVRLLTVLTLFILVPFWSSLMARTFAWVILLQHNGPIERLLRMLFAIDINLRSGIFGVTIAMCQVMLPFMVLPIYTKLKTLDTNLVAAAQTLGASNVRAFATIYLPLSAPGVAAGSLLVFVISLGFYVTPALLAEPRYSMISQLIAIKVDPLLQFGSAGALSAVVIGAALGSLVIANVVRFIWRRRMQGL